MKEKLIIKNFGPIKDVELELGRFNILIGEQATGKSTVAKLLAVCRYFSYIEPISPVKDRFLEGLKAWGLYEAFGYETFIFYEGKHYTLTVEWDHLPRKWNDENGDIQEDVEPFLSVRVKSGTSEFANLLTELKKIRPSNYSPGMKNLAWVIPTSFFQNDVAAVMDNPFYLPAERGLQSIFSLGKSSIQNLSHALFNQLAKLEGIARQFTSETQIEPLQIVYKNENGKGYVRKKTETTSYSLFNAATSYQSIIPIVLTAKYYSQFKKKTKTLIIEEPELSLFPSAQNSLVRFLVDRCVNYSNPMLLTTHSPYVLTSVNNLLYAFKVGAINQSETERIVEKKYWLDPREFSIYKLNPDGTCENIFDEEEEMIKVEEIDKVSEKLNAEFDKLMDIEFVKT